MTALSPDGLEALLQRARARSAPRWCGWPTRAKSPHVGLALSSVDLLVALYFRVMDVDPAREPLQNPDRFVLEQGPRLHGVLRDAGGPRVLRARAAGDLLPERVGCSPSIPRRWGFRGARLEPARSATGSRSRPVPPWPASCAASRDASSCSSATANATRAASGRRRCSPPVAGSTTWWSSWTTTSCRRWGARTRSPGFRRSPGSGPPSASARGRFDGTLDAGDRPGARGGSVREGAAQRHRRAHGEGEGGLLHGERPRVALSPTQRRGPRPGARRDWSLSSCGPRSSGP